MVVEGRGGEDRKEGERRVEGEKGKRKEDEWRVEVWEREEEGRLRGRQGWERGMGKGIDGEAKD